MQFSTPLVPARLLRRYKRFLADCRLETGEEVTAHCANPGSMMGLAAPDTRIWLEPNDDPKRKLRFAWRLVEHADGALTGVDTSVPNRLVREALEAGAVTELTAYGDLRAEVRYGNASRVDFLLREAGLPDVYLEVKSATLSRRPGLAEFPDSVTARGARHMVELARMAQAGHRAILLFVVQRTDCDRFALAQDIDPAYAEAVATARAAGVDVMVYGTDIGPDAIRLARRIDTEA